MKKIIVLSLFILTAVFAGAQTKSLYDFTVNDINGKSFELSSLKGKWVLIVNVASKCGLTPQYAKLQQLYDEYKDRDFVIVGFPCNDFMNQEPGSNEEIAQFCEVNYGVTFPLMDKVVIKDPAKIAPIYKWLTQKSENGKMDVEVKWNFQKFMIDPNGHLYDYIIPQDPLFYDKVVSWLENQ